MVDTDRLDRMTAAIARYDAGAAFDELVTEAPEGERAELVALLRYHDEWKAEWKIRHSKAQRRARRLLEEFLDDEQRRQMGVAWRGVDVVGSNGGHYRLMPSTGAVELRAPRGRRSAYLGTFCYHEDGESLPPADRSLAHLLLLTTDEGAFWRAANFRAEARVGRFLNDVVDQMRVDGVENIVDALGDMLGV